MPTVPILEKARLSVWQAIDNWPTLRRDPPQDQDLLFEVTYRFDEEITTLDEIQPTVADMPALALFPATAGPDWFAQRLMNYPFTLDFALWTPDWTLSEPDRLWQEIVRAVHQAKPIGTTVSYVKTGTGYHPVAVGPVSTQRIRTEADGTGPKAILRTWQIIFRLNFDPFGTG